MPRRKYWKKARKTQTSHGTGTQQEIRDGYSQGSKVGSDHSDPTTEFDKASSVQGNFNQAHPQFKENSGRQCVANSCVSILFDEINPCSLWTSDDLDSVLKAGDELYSSVISGLSSPEIYLLVSELPSVVDLFGVTFSLKCGESLTGILSGDVDPTIDCHFLMSLDNALKRTLTDFNSCFINFASSTFSVIKRDQHFYVFDSHSRNSCGMQVLDGKSVIVKYETIDQVYDHCRRLAVSMKIGEYTQFEITGMQVTVVKEEAASDMRNIKVSEHMESTDDEVVVAGTTCSEFSFHPLTPDICTRLCLEVGIVPESTDHLFSEPAAVIGDPCKIHPIKMDGNCFFRAVSYVISGTEENHRKIRLATVKHILKNADAFTPFLRANFVSVEDYICRSGMKYVKSWATEVELLAVADMLDTNIFTFSCSRWLKYSSSQIHYSKKSTDREIYLQHFRNSHYDVVCCIRLSVESNKYCSRACKDVETNAQQALQEFVVDRKHRRFSTDVVPQPPMKKSRKGTRDSRQTNRDNKRQKRENIKADIKLNILLNENQGSRYSVDKLFRKRKKENSRMKYAQNPSLRSNVIEYNKEKYAKNTEFKNWLKNASIEKYAKNEKFKKRVKKASIVKYAEDEEFRKRVKDASIVKYAENAKHRRAVIKRSVEIYSNSASHRENLKERNLARNAQRKHNKSQITHVIAAFKETIVEAPNHICSVCHRRLFRKQVVFCKTECYIHKGQHVHKLAERCISKKYLDQCTSHCVSPCDLKNSPASTLWICFTCHRKISNGKMPAEAVVNNLHVEPVPEDLKCLNTLEQHLIAKHIPFAKVAALPRGAQKGVHGPVVCVPSNIDKTVTSLPRCDSEDQLIRVKLKRKLSYKGHYQYQFVNTARIQKALSYLKQNNKYYEKIAFNNDWVNPLPSVEKDKPECADGVQSSFADLDEAEMCENEPDSEMNSVDEHGMHMDSCLQPVDIGQEILDQHFDRIVCLAPAEGNDPVKILMDETNEAKSFPVLFPKGSPTYHDDREARITIGRYLHMRLLLADTRFARNTEYIFYSQYLSEVYQVISSVSIALRKSFVKAVDGKIHSERLTDIDSLREILKCDSGYKFLRPIRGTPAFWQSTQKDLFAMLRQLGIPTWFCSFSAGDVRWTEVIECLLTEDGDCRNADDLDYAEKCALIRRHPVTAARMFDHRFHCFLKEVILSDACPVGKVTDYFYRVEFQQRGSPHTHCLFWVKDAPQLDRDTDEEVMTFIDQYVTCEVPSPDDEELYEIVTNVQRHSRNHSKSCRKKATKCRFSYPRPPCMSTYISRPSKVSCAQSSETDSSLCISDTQRHELTKEEAKVILEKIWKALEDTDCNYENTEGFFLSTGVTEHLFKEAYDKLSKKVSIVLQRSIEDVWVNQYNANLLRCWSANMDIQYVLDAYSCIVYIISYISKAEREMGLLLEHARKESLDGNEDAKQAMKKLGGVYLNSRELSAQEAVYRVCNLHLKESSRFVQFIPIGDNAVKMSLPLSQLKNKSKGGELDTEDMWMSSIVDKYQNRPSTPEFENMCLATFCSEFRTLCKSEEPFSGSTSGLVHKLLNDLGYIRKRTKTKPAVIRYPRFSRVSNSEKYHQSILQLFLPHRSEIQLKPSQFESYENFYETGIVKLTDTVDVVKAVVNRNKACFETDVDEIDRAEEVFEMSGPLEDAWAQICPETESERLACLDEASYEHHADPLEDKDIPDLLAENKKDHTVEICQAAISFEEGQSLLRSLNKKQQEVFYKVRHWCLSKINGDNPEPFHVFVTGGAGTGKTHLIRSIQYEASRILARSMPNPDDISVLLTAPTGIAAFNINASTVHSTFSIGVDSKLPYQPLGEEKLNSLRSKLRDLQILVIDEISMVDHRLLAYIHGRLRQIKQCSDYFPFGKVSVIAVGDFYQLSPVKGKPLYSEVVGVNLWSDNFQVVELTEIMRQKNGAFAAILNRLRTRKKADPINPEDKHVLMQRETGEDSEAVHIFATNHQVDEYNMAKIHSMSSDLVCIEAQDFLKDPKSGKLKRRETQYIKVFNTSLSRHITLCEGARVLLTKNIDISDGLVNGVFGSVSHIQFQAGESMPSVFVVFDNAKVGAKLRKHKSLPSSLPQNSTPITPQEDHVNSSGGLRRQFPLKLSFACTVHKLQGLTLKGAVVSLNKIFTAGQSYVALSRVTSLQGLIIQNFEESVIYCNEKVGVALSSMMPFITSPEPSNEPGHRCKLILHNVQCLMSHVKDIQLDDRFLHADFIGMTETWLTSEDPQGKPELNGFILHHKPRQESYTSSDEFFANLRDESRGGVGVYHKVSCHWELLDVAVSNLECLVFLSAEHNIIVAVIYRPLSYKLAVFRHYLCTLLNQLDKFPLTTIVMGDFNENIMRSFAFVRFMEEHGFKQCVTQPTTEGGTLIDHVYVRGTDHMNVHVHIIPTYFSYHEALSICL